MANSSSNKVAMGTAVSFDILAGVEKTIVLPVNCVFAELVNVSEKDVYFAVGDKLATANANSRLMASTMQSVIVKPIAGHNDMSHFKEISLLCASNATIRFMNLSPASLI